MNGKRLLVIGLLGLFMISMFGGVVSAEDSVGGKLLSAIKGNGNFLGTLTDGTWFAQILLFILVTLIVYAISEAIPFLGKRDAVSFWISVVIGVLSVFFLRSEEVYTILLSYSAFGIALTSIIPFMLTAIISKKLFDKGHTMFSKILWIAMGAAVLVKFLGADFGQIGSFGVWVYSLVLIAVVIMVLWQQKLYYFIFKQEAKDFQTTFNKDRVASLRADLDILGNKIEATTDAHVEDSLRTQYNKKAAKLRKLGVDWKDWGKGP